MNKSYFLVWWLLSDRYPSNISMCEKMAILVCGASKLKASDYRLKSEFFSNEIFVKCDLGIMETIHHLLMQCPFYVDNKNEMYTELSNSMNEVTEKVPNEPQHIFYFLMGKHPEGVSCEEMIDF